MAKALFVSNVKTEDKELIKQAAVKDHRSVSSFFRISAIERANKILGESNES